MGAPGERDIQGEGVVEGERDQVTIMHKANSHSKDRADYVNGAGEGKAQVSLELGEILARCD